MSPTSIPSSPLPGRRPAGGFTLIELMIVVAIIAFLAAIAYPAYTNAVMKGKRGQGRAALLDLLQQQERYLTQNGSYMKFAVGAATGSAAGTTIASTTAAIAFKTISGDNPTQPAYKLGARECPGMTTAQLNECVQVYAQPQYADPAITELQIQSTGAKSCTGANTSVCW